MKPFAPFLLAASLLALPTLAANPRVMLETNLGKVEVELFEDRAPISVANFLTYVNKGHYDGTIFHRIIKGFMVQGGGFSTERVQKPTLAPIQNEANNGLKNQRGTLAMARTSVVDSATSQFFINLVDNTFLDHSSSNFGYAVFGRVVTGMEVVDQMASVPTGSCPGIAPRDCPTAPVIVQRATVVSGAAAPAPTTTAPPAKAPPAKAPPAK